MTSLRNLTLLAIAILFHSNARAFDVVIEDINETAYSLNIESKISHQEQFYGTHFREGIDANPDYKPSGIVAVSPRMAYQFLNTVGDYPFKSRIDPETNKVAVTLKFRVNDGGGYIFDALKLDLLFFNSDSKKYFARLPIGICKKDRAWTYKGLVDPNKWDEVWAKADYIFLFGSYPPSSKEELEKAKAEQKKLEAEKAHFDTVRKAGYDAGEKYRKGKTRRPSKSLLTRIAKVKAKQAEYFDDDESLFVEWFMNAFGY